MRPPTRRQRLRELERKLHTQREANRVLAVALREANDELERVSRARLCWAAAAMSYRDLARREERER